MQFTNDELILAMVSVVRVVNPRMLSSGPDGFTVDLTPLQQKEHLNSDEQLLVKLYGILARPNAGRQAAAAEAGTFEIELLAEETARLNETLAQLERMQDWPEDVLSMSRAVRERLRGAPNVRGKTDHA